MTEEFNYCLAVGQTDVGRRRAANEDNMGNAVTVNGLVSVVCDGMGGHVGGATASKIAVNAILANLDSKYYDDPRMAIGESIDIANQAILNEAAIRPELSGMGSTCVLLLVRNGRVYIGHVGDSRIYLIRSRRIIQLTKDHSYVQMLVDRGEITKEQAEHHPRKNEITNALGIPNMSPATVADDAIVPEAGDCFLLCSDGLSGMVPDSIISKVISRQTEMNAQERVDRLIALANENGGVDNITAQMVEFTVSPDSVQSKKKLPLWLMILISVLVLASLGVGTYFWMKSRNEAVESSPILNPGDAASLNIVGNTNIYTATFEKNAEFLTLFFTESSLKFVHDHRTVYEDHHSFDIHSLDVKPSCVEVWRNDNDNLCVLKFTDVEPKEKVVITVSYTDSSQGARFIVEISNGLDSLVIQTKPDNDGTKIGTEPIESISKPKTDAKPSVPAAKKEQRIDLGENELQTGAKLTFSYSETPCFKLNDKEKSVKEVLVDEIQDDEITFDKSCWEKSLDTEQKQLVFTYKGSASTSGKMKFSIPCCVKKASEPVVFEVSLTVLPAKADPGTVQGGKQPEIQTEEPKKSTDPEQKYV